MIIGPNLCNLPSPQSSLRYDDTPHDPMTFTQWDTFTTLTMLG